MQPLHHHLSEPAPHRVQRATRSISVLACLGAAVGLSACSTVADAGNSVSHRLSNLGGLVTPYKVEVVQGNFVSKEQIAALKKGMSRDDVRNILGTPLLTSAFHADRWDYAFLLDRQGVPVQNRKFTVTFKSEALETFAGDTMPAENDFVASLVPSRSFGKAPLLEAAPEKLQDFASRNTKASAAAPAAPPAVRTDYPLLEPSVRR